MGSCESSEWVSPTRGPAPAEALLHHTAAPIQAQMTAKNVTIKPGFGKQRNVLSPAATGLTRSQTVDWTRSGQ